MSSTILFKNRKIAAGIMAVMVLAVVLFSAFFIAVESHHDCTGEECPVCASVEACVRILQQTGAAGAAAETVAVIPAVILFLTLLISAEISLQETLVCKKVRLND